MRANQPSQMPVGPWSDDKKMKDIGLFISCAISTDLEGALHFHFGQVMGWSPEEIKTFVAHVRQELAEKKQHGYWTWKCVYAQKPLDSE